MSCDLGKSAANLSATHDTLTYTHPFAFSLVMDLIVSARHSRHQHLLTLRRTFEAEGLLPCALGRAVYCQHKTY